MGIWKQPVKSNPLKTLRNQSNQTSFNYVRQMHTENQNKIRKNTSSTALNTQNKSQNRQTIYSKQTGIYINARVFVHM